MSKIKFEKTSSPAGSVQFSRNPSYGSAKPFEFRQPKDYSDGGSIYVYNKGLIENTFELLFNNMPESDYQNMEGFFKNIIQGSKYNFTYYDENGTAHTARLMDESIDFQINGYNRRTGSITLRKE